MESISFVLHVHMPIPITFLKILVLYDESFISYNYNLSRFSCYIIRIHSYFNLIWKNFSNLSLYRILIPGFKIRQSTQRTSRMQQRLKQSLTGLNSPWQVSISNLKSDQLFSHSWKENNWMHPFPKSINDRWNANNLVKDLNLVRRTTAAIMQRPPLYFSYKGISRFA